MQAGSGGFGEAFRQERGGDGLTGQRGQKERQGQKNEGGGAAPAPSRVWKGGSEVALQEAGEGGAVAGFVLAHLVDGVVDGV